MNEILELHDKAMELADQAFLANRQGDEGYSRELYARAFHLEREAAERLRHDLLSEPTRSVLFRSASSLAIEVGDYKMADQLAIAGLAGKPPADIAEELHDLLGEAVFRRKLQERKIDLQAAGLSLSIAGDAVGHGITLSDVFIDRVKDLERVLFRTAERLLGNVFRERGALRRGIQSLYSGVYLTAPRAGSFEVTLRLGRQMELPGFDFSAEVVDEVLECFSLLSRAQEDRLKQRIPQEPYYQNFLALAKRIAPDGERVSLVGLSSITRGKQVNVAISRKQKDISLATGVLPPGEQAKLVSVTGRLLLADARRPQGRIQLVDKSGASHPVAVPEGMMNDIVRPLWDDTVTVTGIMKGKTVHLKDITLVES